MSTMKIEVLPDLSVSSGGHGIIRLRGVSLLPPGATYRIDPIDETLLDDEGWPVGELRPLETRQTPDGLELLIGPDVVDAPALEPGIPVTISVPEAHLTAEVVWPALPPSLRAAEPVVMTPAQMAEIAAAERANAEAWRAAEVAEIEARRTAETRAAEEYARREAAVAAAIAAAVAPPPVPEPAVERAMPRPTVVPLKLSGGSGSPPAGQPIVVAVEPAATVALAVDAAPTAVDPPPVVPPPAPSRFDGEDGRLLEFPRGPAPTVRPMSEAARQLDAILAMDTAPAPPREPDPAQLRAGIESLSTLAALTAGAAPKRQPANGDPLSKLGRPHAEPADRDATLPAIVVKQAHQAATASARTTALEPQSDRMVGLRTSLMPFLAGIATMAVVAIAALVSVGGSWVAQPTGPLGVVDPSASKIGIADAFMAGPQSPRGEMATDVDLATALRLADTNLHGVDRPADRVEAEFWLKKAMSLTASNAQLRWAMTQLGTMSAQPVSGAPDYHRARMLWEIAAFNGDPIAMCFLGMLAENGLGRPADRGKALEYYRRAKEIGGCPSSDEAIARLSR